MNPLRRLFRLVATARQTKWVFGPTEERTFALVDLVGSDALYEVIARSDTLPIAVRGEFIRADWRMIPAFLRGLIRTRSISVAYVAAAIRRSGAKVAVTFIDNSRTFQALKPILPGVHCVAIQNGARFLGLENPGGNPPIAHDHFVCFGRNEIDLFTSFGADVAHFHPFGSLRESSYSSGRHAVATARQFDICLVSQVPEAMGPDHLYFEPIRNLVEAVGRYVRERGASLAVALRSRDADSAMTEEQFIRETLNVEAVYIPNIRELFSSYVAAESSRLVIGVNSTLLSEMFGRGQPTLFCNLTDKREFDCPKAGIWSLTGAGYDDFAERVTELLELGRDGFSAATISEASYFIDRSPEGSTHERLRKLLDELSGQHDMDSLSPTGRGHV